MGKDVVTKRLQEYGEAFMQLFDWEDTSNEQQPQQPDRTAVTAASASMPSSSSNSSGSDGSSEDASGNGRSEPPDSGPVEFVFSSNRVLTQPSAGSRHCAPGTPATPCSPAARQARRSFMSAKASKVHQLGGPAKPETQAGGGSEQGVADREVFRRMQQDVQLYGAAALDKKQQKAFQQSLLRQSGARPDKQPRTPASIGKGQAKKQAEREHKALEAAMEAGMVQRKGLGKKQRRAQSQKGDRGLAEDGGKFRPGLLRLTAGSTKGKRHARSDAGPIRRANKGKKLKLLKVNL